MDFKVFPEPKVNTLIRASYIELGWAPRLTAEQVHFMLELAMVLLT